MIEIVNNRVAPTSMEARGCLAEYDPDGDRMTLRTGGQGVHGMQAILAEDIFRIDPSKIRVIQADVGGGFGMKIWVYPEYPACLFAARALKRPVKWLSDRSEAFLSDTHGRDHLTKVEIAVDQNGRMTALRANVAANLGAYLSQFGPFIPTAAGAKMYAGVYQFQAVHFHVRCAFTNTAPVDAYRGAGRPEAAYAVERAVDATARDLEMDPADLRRRNFIPPEAMPYNTALETTYDSGEFARLMDAAREKADVAGFATRKARARDEGKLLGLGVA
jgi:aerobic carbon-monoxide dehydrogenase large subunit